MANSRQRLAKEFKDVMSSKESGDIQMSPSDSNFFLWTAHLEGPVGTPFEGGKYVVELRVPDDYPLLPPTARFKTKIFHPNVHFKSGQICLDILKTTWSPAWTLQAVCQAILSLMSDPEPDSPLNCDAGNLLRVGDTRGYNSLARMYTIEFAQG